jgi:hypothetical protein
MNSANHRRTSFLLRACLATLCSVPLWAAAQTNAPLTAPGAALRTAPVSAPAAQTYRPAINTVQALQPVQAVPGMTVSQPAIRTVQVAPAAPQPGYTVSQPVYAAPQPVYAAPQPVSVAPRAAYAAPAPTPAYNSSDELGVTTRGLLAAQADGRRAGPELPILGPVATASWQRYVESFEHPIPEYFVTRVNTGGASGGN